jgi:hypothetical protein
MDRMDKKHTYIQQVPERCRNDIPVSKGNRENNRNPLELDQSVYSSVIYFFV